MRSNPNFDGSGSKLANFADLHNAYEDEISQGEPPHICPEDESLGEESDKNADQQPRIPSGHSRLHRQNPSRRGRVAYVIYGGITDTESGVYYNWPSCKAVILRYCKNSAPPYLGFNAEAEAMASFTAFQTSGQLPPGIFFPPSLQLLDGSPVPQQLTPTAKHCDRPPPSSHTTISPSPSHIRSAVVTASSSLSGASPSPNQHNMTNQARQPFSLATSSLSSSSTEDKLSFYVVIEGHAPGIYGSKATALHARGLQGAKVFIYTTREAANQAFVDAYMTGRVTVSPAHDF